MHVKSRQTTNRDAAFDDNIIEFYIELPSGRTLYLGSIGDTSYTAEEAEKDAAKRRAEIQSMIDEYLAEKTNA